MKTKSCLNFIKNKIMHIKKWKSKLKSYKKKLKSKLKN